MAPASGDERKETVLELVPLAGAWRKVKNGDCESEFIGELLQLDLPEAHARAVAAAAIGRDRQATGLRVALVTHRGPPGAYRIDRESRSIVVDPDADPAFVIGDVIDPVGRGAAERRVDEVMDPNRLG